MISWTMPLGHSVVKENITYSVLFTPYLFVSKKISNLLFNSKRERDTDRGRGRTEKDKNEEKEIVYVQEVLTHSYIVSYNMN